MRIIRNRADDLGCTPSEKVIARLRLQAEPKQSIPMKHEIAIGRTSGTRVGRQASVRDKGLLHKIAFELWHSSAPLRETD